MINVAAILKRKNIQPVTVPPGTSVLDALKLMAEKNIGSVVVMEGKQFRGIMTERDYSRKVVLASKHSQDTRVDDIMSTNLPPVAPSDSIEHCMEIMTKENIRYMPVMENGEMTGIVSMSDVVKETILSQKEVISHLQNYIQQ